MEGARKYYDLFNGESQQIGRLYLHFREHARGKCLHIYLLPKDVTVDGGRIGRVKDAVEIYGVVSGNPGWTEAYGWLHKGKWQDDFAKIIQDKEAEVAASRLLLCQLLADTEAAEQQRIERLLESYE